MARFEINGEVYYGLSDGYSDWHGEERDLSEIYNKYFHIVRFDFKENKWIMRDEPYDFCGYRANKPFNDSIRGTCNYIEIFINIEENDRKLAENIAQGYLAELLSYNEDKKICDSVIESMNKKLNLIRCSK